MKQEVLEAGKIVSTHGVRGEVKILPWADDADFLVGLPRVFVAGREYAVQHSRVQKTCVLMKLAGIDDVDTAAKFREQIVRIHRDDMELPEGSVFIADLIGLRVIADGEEIGKVSDILSMPGNDVYVVTGSREYLIPAVPEFILERNLDAGFVRVKLIEGM
ncbi:MAG: ribosome maturation factor RimM [Clostridiales bacterium]|nr:ribosome maturation factor RimM [Clostridiales bacterium]